MNILISIFLILTPLSAAAQNQGRNLPIPVEVTNVTKGSVEHSLALIGTAHPPLRATIGSEIEGCITLFNIDEGTFIEEGEAICQLDKTRRIIQLDIAQASLNQAQAELVKLKTGYRKEEEEESLAKVKREKANLEKLRLKKQRVKELFDKDMASSEERDNAYWEYEESQAKLAELQAGLSLIKAGSRSEDIEAAKALLEKRQAEFEEIQYELNKTNIIAPFAGVVIAKFTEKGEWIKIGDKIAEIINLSKVLVHTEVSEKDISLIKLGQSAKCKFDAYPDETFTGQIKQIIPQADLQSRNFPIRIEVDNPQHHLLAGMFVRLKIPVKKEENVFLVPKDAIIKTADGEYIFIIKGDKAHKTKVEIGSSNGNFVSVTGNVSAGDKVVITNNESLRDKAQVIISK